MSEKDLCFTCGNLQMRHQNDMVIVGCGKGHALKSFTPRTECEDYEVRQ